MAQVQVRDVLRHGRAGSIRPAQASSLAFLAMAQAALTVVSTAPGGKIRRGGRAFAPTDVDRNPQTFIALMLYGLDLTHAHVDRQAAPCIDDCFRRVRAKPAAARQGLLNQRAWVRVMSMHDFYADYSPTILTLLYGLQCAHGCIGCIKRFERGATPGRRRAARQYSGAGRRRQRQDPGAGASYRLVPANGTGRALRHTGPSPLPTRPRRRCRARIQALLEAPHRRHVGWALFTDWPTGSCACTGRKRVCRTVSRYSTAKDQLRTLRQVIRGMNLDENRHTPKEAQWFINARKDEGLRPQHIDSPRRPLRRAHDGDLPQLPADLRPRRAG